MIWLSVCLCVFDLKVVYLMLNNQLWTSAQGKTIFFSEFSLNSNLFGVVVIQMIFKKSYPFSTMGVASSHFLETQTTNWLPDLLLLTLSCLLFIEPEIFGVFCARRFYIYLFLLLGYLFLLWGFQCLRFCLLSLLFCQWGLPLRLLFEFLDSSVPDFLQVGLSLFILYPLPGLSFIFFFPLLYLSFYTFLWVFIHFLFKVYLHNHKVYYKVIVLCLAIIQNSRSNADLVETYCSPCNGLCLYVGVYASRFGKTIILYGSILP